jgi:hypothetical protein
MYPRLVDPMQAVNEAVQGDPARSQQGRLLAAWAKEVGTGSSRSTMVTVRQLDQVRYAVSARPAAVTTAVADRPETLHEVLKELAGTPVGGVNPRVLGKLLAKFKDRVCDGYCLRAGPLRQGAATWWVEDRGEIGEFGEVNSADSRKNAKTSPGASKNRLTKVTKLTPPRTARKGRAASGTLAPRVEKAGGLRRSLRGNER